jgi:hypothetical protein
MDGILPILHLRKGEVHTLVGENGFYSKLKRRR